MAMHLFDIFVILVILVLPIYNTIILLKLRKKLEEKREDK